MAPILGCDNEFIKNKKDDENSNWVTWSEENDRLPLKQRLKMLLASKALLCNDGSFLVEPGAFGCIEADKCTTPNHISLIENINVSTPAFLAQPDGSVMKVGQMDDPVSIGGAHIDDLSRSNKQAVVEIKTLVKDDILDDLDHVVLISRQRMLLQKESKSASNVQEISSGLGCRKLDFVTQQISQIGEDTSQLKNKVRMSVGNHFKEGHKIKSSESANGTARLSHTAQIVKRQHCNLEIGANKVTNVIRRGDSDKRRFFPKVLSQNKPCGEKYPSSHGSMLNTVSTASVNVKPEPVDGIELEQNGKYSSRGLMFSDMVLVKTELETLDGSCRDVLDHMFLSERMKLLSRKLPQSASYGNLDSSDKLVPPVLASQPNLSESANPQKFSQPKKRRKTATDSVETALEEDAPGLLQALMEKGVAVDEMKLYGQTDHEESLDDSSLEESFSELEAVISQLFSHRSSLLKFPPLRCNKGEKVSYCLACLFSLVDQARYLRFRNWPVEWGWCRDLQSFIFVFERHNRIVLERPEYGYATYFFELVNTLPINWQLKRLVTAMKLASCSRVALIEDRALMIGDDLSEGEARVLMEYGWIPNSGLGTMLNYCDRVFHDRRNEKDSSEWSSKIGKLLIDGYNSGAVVPSGIPVKVEEYNEIDAPQIKLEPS
ncbi:hypothetical protein LIER_15158 [Lithospermum erythrorhizon]|uniref:Uncharacterized protein n=1 Tax=Lithospermum erythrorhizon TaxID=34254 RepID=A0AAV3Q5V8_LITER